MQDDRTTIDITELLELASNGDRAAVENFYRGLLAAEVWVPVDSTGSARSELREGSLFSENNFLTVRYQGKEILPIFSSEDFVQGWSPSNQPTEKRAFAPLLQLLPQDLWLHLNPGQEVGKELTPWEVMLLRQGLEALPELLADVVEEGPMEIEILEEPEYPAEFESGLRVIIESYGSITEAFRIFAQIGDEPRLLFALNDLPSEADLRDALRDELLGHCRSFGLECLSFSRFSPEYRGLFDGRTPFFFRESDLAPEPQLVSWWRRLFSGEDRR